MPRLPLIALAALLTLALPAPVLAQDQDDDTPPTQEKPAADPQKAAIDKFNAAVKDLPKTEGEFTLYTRKKEVLAEIKESDLGRLFFVQATLNTGFGPLQPGDPLSEDAIDVFRLEKVDETSLRLVKPNLAYRWPGQDPLALASSWSFPDAILANLRVEAHHPVDKKFLVNLTPLFRGDVFQLSAAIGAAASPGYQFDDANSGPDKVKAFPENAVVRMNLHFKKAGGDEEGIGSLLAQLLGLSKSQLADPRSLPLKVTYNLWYRRDTGYQPRLADPRVGYFTIDYFDVARANQNDRTVRLVQRWDLRKKNPGQSLSEPVKPIVWHLDHSIPAEYRQAVKDGILFWDKAFQKIGYKDALVVKDAPQDPDWDHADGRFNLVRWTMTERSAYGVAWFRTDPLTGQIMNAAVTIDANYAALTHVEYDEQVAGSTRREPWFQEGPDLFALQKQLQESLQPLGWRKTACTHLHEKAAYVAEGLALIDATEAKIDKKTYLDRMVADLVAHEIGHCLGLRHNFAASNLHRNADLADDALIARTGITASVMDYTPLNLAAVLNRGEYFYTPTIGAYDFWAIEYGYADVPSDTPENQRAALQTIAQRSGQPGLMYLTDDDADGSNPLAVRFDLGSDPLNYLRNISLAQERLRDYALERATKNGDTYTRRNALLIRTLTAKFRSANMAVRIVGGTEFRRHLKGDTGEKPTLKPVDPNDQRAAMKYIAQECLMEKSVDLPQEILFGLSPDPESGAATYNAPLRALVGAQQRMVLAQLLSSMKLDAISENEFKTRAPHQPYSLLEHYSLIRTAVMAELGSPVPVLALRRDLQRYYVAQLNRQVVAQPGTLNEDARIIAAQTLKDLLTRIKQHLQDPALTDQMTRLHYQDLADQIERTMKRQTTIAP